MVNKHEDLVDSNYPSPGDAKPAHLGSQVNIPTRSDQPDVPSDHEDFDSQVDAYFNQKMINTPFRGK